jgi:hypothetical protein
MDPGLKGARSGANKAKTINKSSNISPIAASGWSSSAAENDPRLAISITLSHPYPSWAQVAQGGNF